MSKKPIYEKVRWDTIMKMVGDTGISVSEIKSGLVILFRMNRESLSSQHGYNDIAKLSKFSRSTAIRAVKGRIERYFQITRRVKESGRNFANEYSPLGVVAKTVEGLGPECFNLIQAKFPQEITRAISLVQKYLKVLGDAAVCEEIEQAVDVNDLAARLWRLGK